MPYSDNYDLLDYLKVWYQNHREEHIKNTLEYYYKNRTKILKQRKLKYKNSKKQRVWKRINDKLKFINWMSDGVTSDKLKKILFENFRKNKL